jgi:phosphoribosylaminoimidazole-succinocarboxamide synthase
MREVYRRGREFALKRGIDIIDFKGEAGRNADGTLCLGDEWLTGDCCRFVRSQDIVIGQEPPWMDKELVRGEAIKQWNGDKNRPPLTFSPEVLSKTSEAYLDLFQALTGISLVRFQRLVCRI